MKIATKKPETRDYGSLAINFQIVPEGSGLVAEALFMAVLLHALFALVLVDLRFTAFLDGAHGVFGRG